MTQNACPFCPPDPARIAFEGEDVIGLWSDFPTSPGHLLVVPKRHAATWFDATPHEQAALTQAIDKARQTIEAKHRPDGYTIGINVGVAGGQTVPHLHVHVIPRYAGTQDPHTTPRLITGGEHDALLPHLIDQLATADQADIAVGFVQPSGVTRLEEHLRDLLARKGRLRLLTGDYLGITDPDALTRLLDLEGDRELRVFETWIPPTPERPGPSPVVSFHPKSYAFRRAGGQGVAFVGSSNLSESALTSGIEWNYRVVSSQEGTPYAELIAAFDRLFTHPATRPLDRAWIEAYRARRPVTLIRPPVDIAIEIEAPPAPNAIQQEALRALEETRLEGHTAGLVVLATGLGKTWLSAFDSNRPEFRRILFVAHREEILGQALRTFRRIRPAARLGQYTGQAKDPTADVLFASIQTLGRSHHLRQFAKEEFDYLVVDEFHHAAAASYRKLIDHFRPKFMLGLTATPERTDGGDLLALCQENLVYRCDLLEGLQRKELCCFEYFGVPDEVDYTNIPWRNARFDEDALTARLAVDTRAANALEQLDKRGGSRTMAFCVSQRHADFMAEYLRAHGRQAVAVHSGVTSAPRAQSLELLSAGKLDVICAVDVFNEGLDLPELDTVLMLRPTESRIVFLQQLGRGLRKTADDKVLKVIDYIGNHRAFLLKPQALLGLGPGDHEIFNFIEKAKAGPIEIAPGCFVTYDLRTIEIVRGLLCMGGDKREALRRYYEDFRDQHGIRPTATEAFHDGYDPGFARRQGSSWLGFVAERGDLTDEQRRVLARYQPLLDALETTEMAKSYKMLVLLAMLNRDTFPGEIALGDLTGGVIDAASRHPRLKAEIGDAPGVSTLLVRNPIKYLVEARGTGGVPYFAYEPGTFRTTFEIQEPDRAPLQEMARELVDWRLARYLQRTEPRSEGIVCPVKQAKARPIIFIDRDQHPELPLGTTALRIDGVEHEADFVKIAVNVIRKQGEDSNVLPGIMRSWFGPDAGQPGTNHQVALDHTAEGWALRPIGRREGGLQLWRAYSREEIPPLFGHPFSTAIWNVGFVVRGKDVFLLVTLDKGGHGAEFKYKDKFLSPTVFQWESQNRTSRDSDAGQMLRDHVAQGVAVHLFVRRQKRDTTGASRFLYCGPVEFRDWEGDQPITIRWTVPEPVPERLAGALITPPHLEPDELL